MNINNKMIHNCSYCNYESPHKWVVRRHMEKKHQNQNIQNNQLQQPLEPRLKTPYMQGYPQLQPDHHGQLAHQQPVHHGQAFHQQPVHHMQVAHQQPVQDGLSRNHAQVNNQQEQQTGEQHPLDAVHHQPVQAQQAWAQQQGGRVRVFCQKHYHKHAQVNNQPQYQCYM